jgi:hypothetical protein
MSTMTSCTASARITSFTHFLNKIMVSSVCVIVLLHVPLVLRRTGMREVEDVAVASCTARTDYVPLHYFLIDGIELLSIKFGARQSSTSDAQLFEVGSIIRV